MGNEQYFIILTLIVRIVTALPNDEIVFEDSPKLTRMSAVNSSNFASKLPSQSTCGKRKAQIYQIFGSSDSQLGAWPWMVALGYKYLNENNDSIEWLCGGTLISSTHVLTAHTCVANIGNRVLTMARLGELDLDPTIDDRATPLDVPIVRIIKHKEYNRWNYTNDIALLVLRDNIKFTAFIQPICLPLLPDMKNEYLGNSLPFIAGWGSTDFRAGRSTSLREVRIPIINISVCKNAYRNEKYMIDAKIICAGEGGKDACLVGDAGVPLMWLKGNQFYLMGIVTYGKKCGETNYPGVYTRVTSFLDWILEGINFNINN